MRRSRPNLVGLGDYWALASRAGRGGAATGGWVGARRRLTRGASVSSAAVGWRPTRRLRWRPVGWRRADLARIGSCRALASRASGGWSPTARGRVGAWRWLNRGVAGGIVRGFAVLAPGSGTRRPGRLPGRGSAVARPIMATMTAARVMESRARASWHLACVEGDRVVLSASMAACTTSTWRNVEKLCTQTADVSAPLFARTVPVVCLKSVATEAARRRGDPTAGSTH